MKSIFLLATLLVIYVEFCVSTSDHHLWQQWKQVHEKHYDNEDEEAKHLNIWKQAVNRIQEHNLRYDMGLETYCMGVNQFTDLTWDEFKEKYLGSLLKVDLTKVDEHSTISNFRERVDIPDQWDWKDKGRVTDVRNQGNCGSSWAFSAAGAMEGQMMDKVGVTKYLSPQQMVDCSKVYGNFGCNGGWMFNAYTYAVYNGIEYDEDYPYKASLGQCQYNESKTVIKLSGYWRSESGIETSMLKLVYKFGPAAVAVEVQSDFMHYKSGVFDSKTCNSSRVNHAILVTGFGVQNGRKYWLTKNSWGTSWGDAGYIKIVRDKNMCGIASFPSVPLLH